MQMMQEYHTCYGVIGPLLYEIISPVIIQISPEYEQFFCMKEEDIPHRSRLHKVTCEVKQTERYTPVDGELVFQNPERMIFDHHGLERRIYAFNHEVTGITYDLDDTHFRMERKESTPSLLIDISFLEMLMLDKYLLHCNALVLHSSFIVHEGRGIVFTAPSGTGKSTQADLWQRYRHAEIINGDRSIIAWDEEKKQYLVYGLPFCGSSGINQNRYTVLDTIVFLEQAEVNAAEIYPADMAGMKLFQEMSINQWNRTAVDTSMRIIDHLTTMVRLIHLRCDISEDAVVTLEQMLK